eukprot:3342116-Pleurochrysis_carterae.AAC.1
MKEERHRPSRQCSFTVARLRVVRDPKLKKLKRRSSRLDRVCFPTTCSQYHPRPERAVASALRERAGGFGSAHDPRVSGLAS